MINKDTIKVLDKYLLDKLILLGLCNTVNTPRDKNVGKSDYAKHIIQPWSIIQEYNLNYWDGDIIKRVLRKKEGEPRRLDYEKIIHICQERIRQIDIEEKLNNGKNN